MPPKLWRLWSTCKVGLYNIKLSSRISPQRAEALMHIIRPQKSLSQTMQFPFLILTGFAIPFMSYHLSQNWHLPNPVSHALNATLIWATLPTRCTGIHLPKTPMWPGPLSNRLICISQWHMTSRAWLAWRGSFGVWGEPSLSISKGFNSSNNLLTTFSIQYQFITFYLIFTLCYLQKPAISISATCMGYHYDLVPLSWCHQGEAQPTLSTPK